MYYFYWLPIGTDSKVRGVPWVTLGIAMTNVLVFAALHSLPGAEAEAYRWAFKAGHPTVQTAIASIFLHAGPLHLIGNLIFLGVFGPPLESRLGPGRYLIAYIACGWLANLAQAAWLVQFDPDLRSIPIIGASGAISGLMGLFVVRLYFAHLRFASVTMLFLQGMVKPSRFTLPALVGIALWFVLQLVYQMAGTAADTATVCHVAGFLFGGFFGLVMGLHGEGRLESRLARGSRYALEIRVSLDAADAEANDRVRGPGAWRRAVRTIRALDARGLLPIVTATDIVDGFGAYDRFRALLAELGVAKPRVKILPVFPVGRAGSAAAVRLSQADVDGFDLATLPCAEMRAVAADGVYACPILAGLPEARLSDGDLAAALGPAALYHAACVTCHRTGATCRNG